ncbi:unnamed protein product [Cuscuta campestris]|uniref:Ty3 transposon capsid-like protein domain-containing protein n=1 Tax=Cuscuta campestris TaxID=132261 RepID=A0A484LA24_9ASTE|nr:unnamed protein product [Cuscuta campestris]
MTTPTPDSTATPPLTMDDLMKAINNLSTELQATKLQVSTLTASSSHAEPRWNKPPPTGWRPPPVRAPGLGPHNDAVPRIRVEAPRFNGDDPAGWIFRIHNYFDYFQTPECERLQLVTMLIDYPASDWFRYYQTNTGGTSWEAFLIAVRQRFDPEYYENYIGSLSKLQQSTTVLDYQTAFESILNKISGVPEQTLIAMYVSSLRQPVQREVNLRNPRTLQEAFGLARELSACHNESSSFRRPWSGRQPVHSTSSTPTASPASVTVPGVSSTGKSSTPSAAQQLPIVKVTSAQKNERSKKGLCWYCDDKWVPGHHCKGCFLADMGPDDDDDSGSPLEDESQPVDDEVIVGDVSTLNSLAGSLSPRSLKLVGTVHEQAVHVLLDGGSTHNFVHPTVAERLSLVLHPVPPFRVYVGNGDSLRCAYSCPCTPLLLQGVLFEVDLYLLEIHGPDMVLGVQWLQTLGKVSHDYANMTMEFAWNGATVTLRGDVTVPRPISFSHLCSLAAHTSLEFFELLPTDHPPPPAAGDEVIQTPDQQFYIQKLMGFKFRIEYKPGASNKVADALSRRDVMDDQTLDELAAVFLAFAQPIPTLLQDIRRDNALLEDCANKFGLKCFIKAISRSLEQRNPPPTTFIQSGLPPNPAKDCEGSTEATVSSKPEWQDPLLEIPVSSPVVQEESITSLLFQWDIKELCSKEYSLDLCCKGDFEEEFKLLEPVFTEHFESYIKETSCYIREALTIGLVRDKLQKGIMKNGEGDEIVIKVAEERDIMLLGSLCIYSAVS